MPPRWGFLPWAVIYYKYAAPTELALQRFRSVREDPYFTDGGARATRQRQSELHLNSGSASSKSKVQNSRQIANPRLKMIVLKKPCLTSAALEASHSWTR